MKISDVENLSFAEMQNQKSVIIESIVTADPAELAARYLQARMDAKRRDEKLWEQGVEITGMLENLQLTKTQSNNIITSLKETISYRDKEIAELKASVDSLRKSVAENDRMFGPEHREIARQRLIAAKQAELNALTGSVEK